MQSPITLKPQPMKDGSVRLKLVSPFHPEFPGKARNLGGKWNGDAQAWYFDPRDIERVRTLCTDVFGIDPLAEETAETVTVQLRKAAIGYYSDDVWFAGRQVLRYGKVGEGCVLLEGRTVSGGGRKHPYTQPSQNIVIEVRDLPKELVEKEVAERIRLAKEALRKEREALELCDTNPAKASGYISDYWNRLSEQERKEKIEVTRGLQTRRKAEIEEELAVVRDSVHIVETLNSAEVIHEIQSMQPLASVESNNMMQVRTLIDTLTPEECAELLNWLLERQRQPQI